LNQLGFKSKKEYISTIWVVGILVGLMFSGLYLGLAFLGNHFPLDTSTLGEGANLGAAVLSSATQAIFGPMSQIFLAVMVTVTCFTTTAGLIVATGEFFNKAFPQVSYKTYAIVFTLIGFAIANLGLNNIIAFSVPVLLILYPITITIVMIVIANKFVALSKPGMQITVGVVTLIALLSVLGNQFKLAGLNAIINFLPLSGASLPWLIPAILLILLSLVLPDKIKSESFEME
ncbi:MAG: branched-chain amino acid transport system II carrier protein, partial [Streptococcus sp.]|nr:branched-chain amino acid transport system II carrier protein [Streptococcus sp.]